ncbi:MAG: GNAT family N-acetyltransferase [Bacteroidota bacterium]
MLEIRKGQHQDISAIADFQVKMAKETEDYDLDRSTVLKGVKRILDEPARGYYLLSEVEDKVIASKLILFEWSDWRNGEVLWIHSLYVLPEYRGKGIFRKMYDKLKQEVEENSNYRGIRLYVEKANTKAQKVYDAIGMTNEHYDMYEWLK